MLSIILRLIGALLVGFAGGWLLVGGVATLIGRGARLLAQAKPIFGDVAAASLGGDLPGPIVSVIAGAVLIGWALRLVKRAFDWLSPAGPQAMMAQPARASATPSVVRQMPIVPVEPFASDEAALQAWNDGLRLADEGRCATAVAIFRRLAEDHIAGAALVLAHLLDDGGPDLPPDRSEARRWFEIALNESDEALVRVSFGAFLLVEAERSSSDAGRGDRARGINLLWEAVERGMPETLASLSLVHLSASKTSPAELHAAERAAAEANRRGLLLGEFIEARLLKARGHHLKSVWRNLSCIRKSRAIAKMNPEDPRLLGISEFARAISGDESGFVERMLGLKDTSRVADGA